MSNSGLQSSSGYLAPTAPRIVSAAAGGYAILGGLITLAGWAFSLPRLTDWNNEGISMFPNAAACSALSGAALLLLINRHGSRLRPVAVRLLAGVVAAVGGLTLLQHLFGLDFGIDTLLFDRPWGQRASMAPMRIGPPASSSFLLLGAAILLATSGPRGRRLTSSIAILPIAIASLSLIGYWFGADQLFGVARFTGIAWQTSTMVAGLGLGLLAAVPEHGLVAILRRDDAGGLLVRRLLLPILAIPVIVGWLRLVGQDAGLYDTAFGLAMMVLTTMGMFAALLLWTASGISRQSQIAREREERYELVVAGAEAAIWDWDVPRRRVVYSPRWKELRGLSDAEVSDCETEWTKRIHPEDLPRVMAAVQAHFAGRTAVFNEEYRVRHKDGRWIWIMDRGIARRDASGRVVRMAGSETDITERKRAEEALRESDRRKDEFLATLAHELRNPLAPIRNAVEILRLRGAGDADLAMLCEMIDRQTLHMTRLVDDLLDISRITHGRLELRKERVELAAVVEAAVETSRPLIDAKGHDLTVALPAEALPLEADVTRLAQVFSNLLNNAAKYMDRGGRIAVTAQREGSDAVVSVRDHGIGIHPEMLSQVFDLFSQVDHSLERAQGGLGIGLTLTKRLVELHGGSIAALSDGADRGSEFVVRLPIVLAATPAADPLALPERPPTPLAAGRVLVVDDNRDAMESMTRLLTLMGCEVRGACDGIAALELAAEFQPHIIFLDIGMPAMNGYDVCRAVREQPWGRTAVMVAVTGWGQEDDRRKSKDAGFDDHLVKPVDVRSLRQILAGDAAAYDRTERGSPLSSLAATAPRSGG